MIQQSKIAVIACWSGPYPWYFRYFLHSCSFNPTIDFYVIADNHDEVAGIPPNVKIICKTIDEIKAIASERLGFQVAIEKAYKLNDLKPAYGYIFPEIIQGYDFWGHGDLDIICGDMRAFFTDEFLNRYDFISLRHDFTSGCLALYRNIETMNTLFKRSKDYLRIFSDPRHFCFDECSFAWGDLLAGKSILDLKTETESLTYLVKAAEMAGDIRAHFDFILMDGITGNLVFDNGRIIYKNQFEAILYHLCWFKDVYSPHKMPKNIPDKYYISPSRIYHSRKQKPGRIKGEQTI